jgi:glycosyltransferase involved in cell wall biosynthesis
MKVLFLTHLLPYPPELGGYIRTYHLLRCLSRRHEIDLVCYLYDRKDRQHIEKLSKLCRHIEVLPLVRKPNFPYLPLSLFSRRPFWYLRDFSFEMKNLVKKRLQADNYDVIFEEQFQMVGYIGSNENGAYRIYANIMIGESMMRRYGKTRRNPLAKLFASLEALKMRLLETEACHSNDMTIAITEEDRQILQGYGIPADKIVTVPMGVDTDRFKPIPLPDDSKNIVLLGLARLPPNVEGILHFYYDIFPKILRKLPDVHLYIVGKDPVRSVRSLEKDRHVTVTGFVEDLDTFLKRTGVFVVPLRAGGGIKVRTLNALAMGLPVVATTVGVEGVDITCGQDALVASTAEGFANAVIDVLCKPALRRRLCKNGPKLIERKHSWDGIYRKIEELFDCIEDKILS